MLMRVLRFLPPLFIFSVLVFGQGRLHLKSQDIDTGASHGSHVLSAGSGHVLLQFDQPPTPALVKALSRRGVRVLADIPENGLLVSAHQPVSLDGLNVHFKTSLSAWDKISPLIQVEAPANAFYIVEFHQDVDMNLARWLILAAGLELHENPDMQSHQLLTSISPVGRRWTLTRLLSRDEVAYVFPASDELIHGFPVRACEGALTANGTVAQLIQTYGSGWDGPGLGAANLAYVFSMMTAQLDPAATQSEIRRAMAEWSKAIKISWIQASNGAGAQTVNILFGAGFHGDAYPFDGPNGVLAHTFYPAPPNPEPIAGDMHFDGSESWRIGSNLDIFSVALHELGHSLGLGHSDDPSAVMYPYYRMVTQLSNMDKASAQTLYAVQGGTTTSTPTNPVNPTNPANPTTPTGDKTAPAVTITTPSTATFGTSSASFVLRGTASDNIAVSAVTWATNFAKSGPALGTASWTASVPLLVGMNAVTIKAIDGAGNTGSRTVVITRR